MVGSQEIVCLGRLQDLKQLTEDASTSSRDWSGLMRMLAAEAEVAFWNARIEWLQNARELLEQLRDEHEPSRREWAWPTLSRARMPRLRGL